MKRNQIPINRKMNKALVKAASKSRKHNANRIEETDHIVYKDNSYKDKRKVVHQGVVNQAKQRIKDMHKKFALPEFIHTLRKGKVTDCMLVNLDGKERAFLPNKAPGHYLYVHANIARALVSGVCMFARVTKNKDKDGNIIDGSWALVPAEYEMMQATTIQSVERRTFWFLRKYHYRITFDGRVQPAHLLWDYGINPAKKHQRLYVTREYVPVRKTDKSNDYFRFWYHRPPRK